MTSQFGCTWDFTSFVVRFEFAAYATNLNNELYLHDYNNTALQKRRKYDN